MNRTENQTKMKKYERLKVSRQWVIINFYNSFRFDAFFLLYFIVILFYLFFFFCFSGFRRDIKTKQLLNNPQIKYNSNNKTKKRL